MCRCRYRCSAVRARTIGERSRGVGHNKLSFVSAVYTVGSVPETEVSCVALAHREGEI